MIKGFSEWNAINESLSLRMAKRYAKIQREEAVQQRLDQIIDRISSLPGAKHSKRKERIYLPFDSETEFSSSDFRTRSKIEEVLQSSGFKIQDYKNGIAIDNFGRQTKIAKALVKLKRPDLVQQFNADAVRAANKAINDDMMLVFSKSSYDIAGMSTDRKWDSCMNVITGVKSEYVACDIEQGSFICYLTSLEDENLKSPIARILIKPYQNVADKEEIIYVPDPIYGDAPYNFYGQVEDVLRRVQQERSESFYQLVAALNQENQIGVRKGLTTFSRNEGFMGTVSKETRDIIDNGTIVSTKQEISQILDELLITNYTINDDLSVDVDGDVDMGTLGLKRFPFKFGKVTGNFDCSKNKKLQTLEGGPRIVGGDFICIDCGLTTLKGAPQEVQGISFQCGNNRLTNLQYLPKLTGNDPLLAVNQNMLESLSGCPTQVHTFYCDGNKLKTLEGAPKKTVAFHCSNNELEDFSSGISVSFSFTCLNNNPVLDKNNKDLIKKLLSSVKCKSYEIGTDNNRIMIGDNNSKVWYIDKENKSTTMVKKFNEWINESLHSGVPVDFFKKIHQYSKKRPLDIQADITDDLINNDLEDVSHHFYELGTNPPEEED